jgi:hypothetical protein
MEQGTFHREQGKSLRYQRTRERPHRLIAEADAQDPRNYTEAMAGAVSLIRVAQVPFRSSCACR